MYGVIVKVYQQNICEFHFRDLLNTWLYRTYMSYDNKLSEILFISHVQHNMATVPVRSDISDPYLHFQLCFWY